MFYLKNDDMEDLFRKAAENYELDTGKASNWEAVNHALNHEQPEKPGERKKKKRRFIFWWFLLFPAGWLAHNTWLKTGENMVSPPAMIMKDQSAGVKTANEVAEDELFNARQLEKKQRGKNNAVDVQPRENSDSTTGRNYTNSEKPAGNKRVTMERTVNRQANTHKETTLSGNAFALDRKSAAHFSARNERRENHPIIPEHQKVAVLLRNHSMPVDVSRLTGSLMQLEKNSGEVAHSEKKNETISNDNRYFYLTAIGAPDLTSVKFQRISGAGSGLGLVVGYRINKRIHIEAAVLLEKKIYYTDGRYFDKSKLSPYYQNVKMLYVDGSCKMITIPVNIRYNLFSNKQTNWFVGAGMSSYLMNEEYYDYTYQHYNEPPKTKGYLYKKNDPNWMSVININVGYEKTFWRKYLLRVEPYFRLPVSGMGTGSLPLTSGGVFLGFGRRF